MNMGNGSSSSDSEDNAITDYKDNNIPNEIENDYVLEKDNTPLLDLQGLFDHSLLRAAAAKVKDDLPENPVQQHHGHLIRWLEERLQRGEETITLGQFCDVLMSRSVNREDSIRAFVQFDSEGDGTADVTATMDALRASNGANLSGELTYIVRKLQACSLTPGFIDVYTGNKQVLGQHGLRILNFILRNRAPSTALPFPILNGFNNTMTMRLTVLNSHLNKLKDNASKQQEESLLNLGEELKPITKCFKLIEVSTNTADSYRLTNSDFSSYWQSDGSARSHWIRLRVRQGVVIKQLHVSVAASDQSYMPQLISVSVGNSAHSLHEIKEVRVPSHITGEVLILENCKSFYPVVQINIKRCHSDGCDTRIHGLKTLGYRVVKEAGVSVMDASAAWYLQVLATTASACIPMAPHIRSSIRQHTRDALKHMGPLALSPASHEKPLFMTSHVLQQMDVFLHDIAKDEDAISPDGLYLLLAFNLSRGHVAGTLRALQSLQENANMNLEAVTLLKKLSDVRDTFWKKQSNALQMALCGSDGGSKDDTSGPQNVLTTNWGSSQPYVSADGKTKVNMFFKSHDQVQITRLRIKVDKGKQRPRGGLVFVYKDPKPFKIEEHVERFAGYDTWTQSEYNFCQNVRINGFGGKPDNPVALFTVDEDWDEVEVPLDICPVGQYVLIKFLEPRNSDVEKISIVGIKFYGFVRKAVFSDDLDEHDEEENSHTREIRPNTEVIEGKQVLLRVLDFMVSMARDQVVDKHQPAAGRPQYLDMQGLKIEFIWKLYQGSINKRSQIFCLQLLHALFPFLSSDKEAIKDGSEDLFKHLCSLVDNNPEQDDDKMAKRLVATAQQVIIDGAAVFFSDKDARRKQLFNMMNGVNSKGECTSLLLTFQSLCQFFSNVDPSGLLDLPTKDSEKFDCESVLAVMETLISVAHKELNNVLNAGELTEQSSHLVNLLCSLQTSLLGWCQQQNETETSKLTEKSQSLLIQYIQLITSKSLSAMEDLSAKDDATLEKMVKKLEGTFIATAVRQMVLILTAMGDTLTSNRRVKILNSLMALAQELRRFAERLPRIFYNISSEHWKALESGEETLRNWEVESAHNYDNNQHSTQVFNCPGASYFIVEFDPRSETEKRYDYLEFTDSNGIKMKFDQKVGTEKWPTLVTFRGGHRLHFLFHSDSSNNEWGYKFKVIAKGCPDEPLSWIFDLELSLAKLFGRLCGATLDSTVLMPNQEIIGDVETDLLKSDLWTTLFRGGYKVGKLQRSLSGKHVANEDSEVSSFLFNMLEDDKEEIVVKFLEQCGEQYTGVLIGDEEVSEAVNALFAALIWHSQGLREELQKYIKNEGQLKLFDGFIQTFNTTQSQRTALVDQRQKYKVEKEKETTNEKLTDPVKCCKEKSIFLLKFSGLTKVDLRRESRRKLNKQTSRHHRLSNYALDRTHRLDGVLEKYPAFRLVLEFVKDPAWSLEKVDELLKERSLQAQAVSEVYMFAAEYLRIMAHHHVFQLCNVLFIQELLCYQDRFSKHYADGLDGCGLDLESKVRHSYYTLIRRLIDGLRSTKRLELDKTVLAAYDYIQACTLHLMDINWQQYDLTFLVDIKLPEFYLALAKESVAIRQQILGSIEEDKEMEVYNKDMEMLKECKKGFMDWYNKTTDKVSTADKMAKQMFVAKFCDLLDVEISCDGCSVTLPGRRYRCLQCEDMDLCATCYAGGVKPRVGNHNDDHEIIHMMYKCDQCKAFITGTRIHCNQCEDFDLCLGCHKTSIFPTGHEKLHDVIQYPIIKLKIHKDWDMSLQAYIHQHVWLSFSTLALSMAHIIYNNTMILDATPSGVDSDYVKACTLLHNQCIELAISCLMKVHVLQDPMAQMESEEIRQKRQEEAFAIHSQERIMGLLGAMIPPVDKSPLSEEVSFTFSSKKFIHLLLNIARGESGHESNTQHLAMGLLGQLLQRAAMSCSVADAAVKMCDKKIITGSGKIDISKSDTEKSEHSMTTGESSDEAPDDVREDKSGLITAKYFFTFGATCMERSGLEWANSLAGILQKLFNCSGWKDVLLKYLSETITSLKTKCSECDSAAQSPLVSNLDLVFNELIGENSTDIIKDVALSYAKELGAQEEKVLKVWAKYDKEGVGKLNKEMFISFAKNIKPISEQPLMPGLPLSSIFALFVLAGFPEVLSIGQQVKYTDLGTDIKDGIVLKHFPEKDQTLIVDTRNRKRRTIKDEFVECVSLDVPMLDGEHVSIFMDIISDISARLKPGQKMSVESIWILALSLKALLRTIEAGGIVQDLFVTSFVQCVVHLASQSTGFSKQWLLKDLEILSLMLYTREKEDNSPEENIEDVTSDSTAKSNEKTDVTEKTPNLWDGLDDTTKICFQTLYDHLNIPMSVLRAIYDMNGRNTDALLVAVHENVEGDSYVATDAVKKMAKKWEQSAQRTAAEIALERAMDTGMQIVLLPKQGKRSYDSATEEPSEEAQKLITATKSDMYADAKKQRKSRSSTLLKEELETQGRTGSREYLVKVNTALAVLYSRQMLLRLLGDWPEDGPRITTDLLGCSESIHLPFVLDLLNKNESKEVVQKVVNNVIHHCEATCLGPLAKMACHFMEEVNLSTVVKESEHNYKNNTNYEDKIHIPGASFLSVKFDSRCCTEEECDELVLSSNEDYQQDRKVFSGPRQRWIDFEMPGDIIFMKFSSDCSSNDWGYKFTVTGGRMGRFDTGYLILNSVFSIGEVIHRLPLQELWAGLVYVACKQTGQQRLKSLQLLLKMLQSQFKKEGCKEINLDLNLLMPLWKLYNKMSEVTQQDPSANVITPLCRALTELFLVAENLAMDWNIVRKYMACLMLEEDVKRLVSQALTNIAAISLAIGYANKTTDGLGKAKVETKCDLVKL